MNLHEPPSDLRDNSFVLLTCDRRRNLTLMLPDKQSFVLGHYSRQHENRISVTEDQKIKYHVGARVYLSRALANEDLTEQALSTAFSFGLAVVHIDVGVVTSIHPPTEKIESVMMRRAFVAAGDSAAGTARNTWADKRSDRTPVRKVKAK